MADRIVEIRKLPECVVARFQHPGLDVQLPLTYEQAEEIIQKYGSKPASVQMDGKQFEDKDGGILVQLKTKPLILLAGLLESTQDKRDGIYDRTW